MADLEGGLWVWDGGTASRRDISGLVVLRSTTVIRIGVLWLS
jgi:hypothetical protein